MVGAILTFEKDGAGFKTFQGMPAVFIAWNRINNVALLLNLVAVDGLAEEGADDAGAGFAVAVGVDGFAHVRKAQVNRFSFRHNIFFVNLIFVYLFFTSSPVSIFISNVFG